MEVYNEDFGYGEIINSTEQVDEDGNIYADILFDHGIEESVCLENLENLEQVVEATKGEVKVNASIRKVMNKAQKEKVGTDDRNSNLQWPLHRVNSDSVDKDDDRVELKHYVRAPDKHKAISKVQMDLIKRGHEINDVKHAGVVKEESTALGEDNYSCGDMKHPDEAEDKTLVKKMVKKSSLKKENVTPASAELRNEAVEHSIREILMQGRNLRQLAKEEDFYNRYKK